MVLEDGQKVKRVNKMEIEKEGYLQEYIHENPESIPVYEIEEDKELLVLAREFATESGPIDALAIDKDGDIYVVETKREVNPDRRKVVAQALDYGASLWRHSDFDEFIVKIGDKIREKFKVSFKEKVVSSFKIDDDQFGILIEAVKRNLQSGNIKFVILMDSIDDRLRDLIVYVNRNSQFDIYAVQMEYYEFEKYKIMIPKLFGIEAKKNVSANSSESPRMKWDEQSFFEDVRKNLDSEKIVAVKKLYDFAKQKSKIIWGTGAIRSSFSAMFDSLGTKPLFVLESGGVLRISFDYPKKGASAEQISRIAELEPLIAKVGIHVEKGTNRTVFGIDGWNCKVDGMIEAISRVADNYWTSGGAAVLCETAA